MKITVMMNIVIIFLLTGCMYPKNESAQNTIPYQDQLQSVQTAIDQFQQDNGGILPIKTFDESTPLYQRYLIDFKRIVPEYLSEPPSNAYESGGVFQYVIVNAENNPTVKIFDLRLADTISEINLRIKLQGYPPFQEKIAENVYTLDFNQLGYKEEPYIVSPYTNQNLSFVINNKAEIFIDYRADLYEAIQEKHGFKAGDDIREILYKDTPFVPVYSLPYTIDEKTKEPIFLMN
jgi:hypothetical protein